MALSPRDAQTVAAAWVPVIVSPLAHCYLDVPLADPQAEIMPMPIPRRRPGTPTSACGGYADQDRRRMIWMGARRHAGAEPGHAESPHRGRDLGRNHLRL